MRASKTRISGCVLSLGLGFKVCSVELWAQGWRLRFWGSGGLRFKAQGLGQQGLASKLRFATYD